MTWDEVFKTTVEGREVTGTVSNEGDYRVRTTTKSDYAGQLQSDGVQHQFPIVRSAGSPVDIEGEDLADLQNNLVTDGESSADAAAEIVKAFGSSS